MVKKNEKEDDKVASEGNEGADEGGTGKASVFNNRGVFIRAYTVEIHGKEYKDLAKQFAAKIGGTVK